jgi:LacI family transcriptional regulator
MASAWWNEDIMRGVAHYAVQAGWHLDMQMSLTGNLPETWNGDGVIVMPSPKLQGMHHLLETATCPVVAMNLSEPQLKLHRVAFDSEAIGSAAAAHFLERAFKSFAWYSSDWAKVEELRCNGYTEAVSAAGFDCTILAWPNLRGERKDTWQNRQQWLQRKLSRLPKPLAVFSTDDTVAVEVIEACLAAKLTIPYDVAVLGVGNVEIFRESTSVPLSSIRVDYETLTHDACDLLGSLMRKRKLPVATLLLPPEGIAIRRSTDTIVSENEEVGKALRFMFEHYPEVIGIPDISRASGTSKTRLYLAFHEELGQSPSQVLNQIRIEKALRMLRETQVNVSVVSKACGFGEPVNLYRCFKRAGIKPPQKYRQSLK